MDGLKETDSDPERWYEGLFIGWKSEDRLWIWASIASSCISLNKIRDKSTIMRQQQ